MVPSDSVKPKFRIIPGNAAPDWPPHGVIASLTAHPFRPGETPNLVTLPLGHETREIVERAAQADRIPCALWLRIAVESTRCIDAVARALGWPPERVASICN